MIASEAIEASELCYIIAGVAAVHVLMPCPNKEWVMKEVLSIKKRLGMESFELTGKITLVFTGKDPLMDLGGKYVWLAGATIPYGDETNPRTALLLVSAADPSDFALIFRHELGHALYWISGDPSAADFLDKDPETRSLQEIQAVDAILGKDSLPADHPHRAYWTK